MKTLEEAYDELWQAAQAIEADLGGNADSRIRQTTLGGFIMIEEARVRWLLHAIRGLRGAKAVS
jgi:hypothetical protein